MMIMVMIISTKLHGLERIKQDFSASVLSDVEEAIGDMTYDQILDSEVYHIFMEAKERQLRFSRTIRSPFPESLYFYKTLFKSATRSAVLAELQKRILLDEPQIIFNIDSQVSSVFISESILQFMIDNDIIERAIKETLIPNPAKYCRTTLLQSASDEQVLYMKMRWNI